MINANFTKTINGISVSDKPLPAYEIRVEKGCGKKSEFMKNVEKGIVSIMISRQPNINYSFCHCNGFQMYPFISEENQYATSKNKFCWNTNLMNGKMAKDNNRSTGNEIF